MRAIVEYDAGAHPPLLRLFIHGAPHRRQHDAVLLAYRRELVAAARATGLTVPIRHPVDLRVLFIDPCSPDLDNLITALYRAVDGKALSGPALLADDGLIQDVRMGKFYPEDCQRAPLPRAHHLRLVA